MCSRTQSSLLLRHVQPNSHARTSLLFFNRHAHALALQKPSHLNEEFIQGSSSSPYPLSKSLTPLLRPRKPILEIRNRVEQLVNQIEREEEPSLESYAYSEDELQYVYANLLAQEPDDMLKPSESNFDGATVDKQAIMDNMAERLLSLDRHLIERDFSEVQKDDNERMEPVAIWRQNALQSLKGGESSKSAIQRALLLRLEVMLRDLVTVKKLTSAGISEANEIDDSLISPRIPIAFISEFEWRSIIEYSVENDDFLASEFALDLMKRYGLNPPEDTINIVLRAYCDKGDVDSAKNFIHRVSNGISTPLQRDLHIKAHLKASELPNAPYNLGTALSTLHEYENLPGLAPPMQSYTRLISALFSESSSKSHAQAWDLFSHMRYVAHAKPDGLLYSLMIRACAGTGPSQSGASATSEPERALDLWKEMTLDNQIAPTVGSYNAIILACARSKKFASEAFRLAKEMLDAHRDAYGNPLLRPNHDTFCALLVAAKTTGDLGRARWILAEMARISEREKDLPASARNEALVDDEIMVHIFHAYASYIPPFRRGEVRLVNEEVHGTLPNDDSRSVQQQANKPSFSATPPQTSGEVVREVEILLERILQDTGKKQSFADKPHRNDMTLGLFSQVSLTPSLLNAYLSVLYKHTPLERAVDQFNSLFTTLDVQRIPRTYVEALERCAFSEQGRDREVAESFAKQVWTEWDEQRKGYSQKPVDGLAARLIERAHTAMIRVETLSNKLDRAMDLLRSFVDTYPPHSLRRVKRKPEMLSTRTVLFAPRPLVRLSSPSTIPDDSVPPLLTFRDLELLHHRLVFYGRQADINYVKFVCKAYESSLRMRRDSTIKG